MPIGERLAILLKEKGMTQKSFSKKIDYSEQSISNLIRGFTKNSNTDLMARTAQFFPDVNLRWLIIGEGEMFNQKIAITEEAQQKLNELQIENSNLKDKIIQLLETK